MGRPRPLLLVFALIGLAGIAMGRAIIKRPPAPSFQGGQAPYFISRERSVLHAKAAHNINLKCKAGGLPMPQVTWYKDNVLLYESLRRFEPYKINQRRLTIPNSTPYDNGVYKCVIANKYGQLEHNITVEVAPQIVAHHPIIKADSPANTTVPLGGNLTLQCDFEYFNIDDPPRIDWYRQIRGNKSIEDNVSASPLRLLQSCQMNLGCYNWTSHEQQHIINPQTLFVPNVMGSDEGWYTCVASNRYGNASNSAWISVQGPLVAESTMEETKDNRFYNSTLIASVGVAFLLIFIICVIVIVHCKYCRSKSQPQVQKWTKKIIISEPDETSRDKAYEWSESCVPFLETNVQIERCLEVVPVSKLHVEEESDYIFPNSDQAWEHDRNCFNREASLGEGEFGCVSLARVKHRSQSCLTRQTLPDMVAVKMLKKGHSDEDLIDLVKEMTIMKHAGFHPNIINLLGVCTQPKGKPFYLIIEYADYGCLKEFLQAHRSNPSSPSSPPIVSLTALPSFNSASDDGYEIPIASPFVSWGVDIHLMLEMGREIAEGMAFLASKSIVHRDLAARNVLVGKSLNGKITMKIADFGLARDINDKLYYRKFTDGKMPIKWMAPEAIFYRYFSTASDVWSFGIVMWEILTLGKSPYKHMDMYSYYEYIKADQRLEQPSSCPNDLYQLMLECWHQNPTHRPSFEALQASLMRLYKCMDRNYLALSPPPWPKSKKPANLPVRP